MTVDLTTLEFVCQNRSRLGNILFRLLVILRKSGLCDSSFFNAVGKEFLVWVGGSGGRRQGGMVFQHCTRNGTHAKMTLL